MSKAKPKPAKGYNTFLKILHWSTVALLIGLFVAIWSAQSSFRAGPSGEAQGFGYINLHKSLGVTLLMVVIIRVIWRNIGGLPWWAPGLADWERKAVHKIEFWLYGCLFVMPILGMIYSITSGFPLVFFGLAELPALMEKSPGLANLFWFLHVVFAYVFIAVIALHIGFVTRRMVYEKDSYIRRMWFG